MLKKLMTFFALPLPKIFKKITTVIGITNLKLRSFIDKL